MANKRKPVKKRNPNQIPVVRKPDEDEAVAIARTALRPIVQAAVTLVEFTKDFAGVELAGLIEALSEQTKAATEANLGRAEAMLATQAHTLDAVFHVLTRRAARNMGKYTSAAETYMKLALRAQSQCRATWEALSAIKNPPMVGYVRQANIAHGHQQVNNAPSTASVAPRARENDSSQNKLLEEKGNEWLDIGAAGAAGRTDPAMATVGEVDGTEDAGG